MDDEKTIYYISIQSGEISEQAGEADSQFCIVATQKEYQDLQLLSNQLYESDVKTYGRSQIPFLEYHHDPQNDEYDHRLIKLYSKIYELGDEETKSHIGAMGILEKTSLNNEDTF
ncbi:hydrolase [Bacillus sp. 1P06AnD]|uniref:hydrolase n=1 Tax=Bacillus sp. 1P06AnD TaxID=3132208 RepID=UPI0039A228B1